VGGEEATVTDACADRGDEDDQGAGAVARAADEAAAQWCSYCDADVGDTCEHVVARCDDDTGGWVAPFDAPAVPEPGEPLEGSEVWSEAQQRAAFGDLYEAARAFDRTYQADGQAEWAAFRALLFEGRLTAPVHGVDLEEFLPSAYSTYYFSPAPDRVLDELASFLARLAAGFRRLAATPPDDGGPAG
jgi:hypothetical protein